MINLHHKDDIYYLVLGYILMHSMMLDAPMENDDIESSDMCSTLSAIKTESSSKEVKINDHDEMEVLEADVYDDYLDHQFQYKMATKWASFHDHMGVRKLKKPMKWHMYHQKYHNEALEHVGDFCNSYGPLSLRFILSSF